MVIHALPRVENLGTSAPPKPRSDAVSLQSGLEGLSIEGEPYVSMTALKPVSPVRVSESREEFFRHTPVKRARALLMLSDSTSYEK
jgi:hypothetical protein